VHAVRFSSDDALDMAIQMQRDVEHTAQALQPLLQKDQYHQ
jgi:hypothetical protein